MSNNHTSDCAIYNEPAYPAGKCDCKGRGDWITAPGMQPYTRDSLEIYYKSLKENKQGIDESQRLFLMERISKALKDEA